MIKSIPEDFIVEEMASLPLRPAGAYRVYLLRKRGWNTLDLLRHLSRNLRLPVQKLDCGGKKDKRGLTSQFITIMDPRDFSREEKTYSLSSRGFMDRPMGPDLIQGNAFIVTARNLGGVDALERRANEVRTAGFPNFFDDQRFRSYDPERGFFAEKILKRHWNGALQVYLTSVGAAARGEMRARKRTLFENWKDWPTCLKLAEEPQEKEFFSYLTEHPKGFLPLLHRIPEEEVSMMYAAYQSHLWNELLRRLIRSKVEEATEVRGREGGYLFWEKIGAEAETYLRTLEIPAAAARMDFPDTLTRSLHEEILKEKALAAGSFRTRALRRVSFRSFPRKALVVPEDLRLLERGKDEFHPARKKLILAFSLPRGSYGTMLIKRLTCSFLEHP